MQAACCSWFKIADDNALLLLDMKDLRAMVRFVGDNAKTIPNPVRQYLDRLYRRHSARIVDAGRAGANQFFGEPMLDINDLMKTDANGHGVINLLAADKRSISQAVFGVPAVAAGRAV